MELICLIISVLILVAAVICAVRQMGRTRKRNFFFAPLNVLFVGVFLAVTILFIPVHFDWQSEAYQGSYTKAFLSFLDSILLALYSAIRYFIADGDYDLIFCHIENALIPAYATVGIVLMVVAPLLTFGFVISFFKNLNAHVAYIASYFKSVYVFSELNDRSVALARDLRRQHPKCAVVFTNVFRDEVDEMKELWQDVSELKPICFRKDILSVDFRAHSKKKDIHFFVIAGNEQENIRNGIRFIKAYGDLPNSYLYVFTSDAVSELLLSAEKNGSMIVRRVNPARSLIDQTLYDEGIELFRNARPDEDGIKQIGAVVVGLGEYGRSMVKALTWFCQMDGYRVKIDAFDQDPLAEERFCGSCPELMDERHNGVFVPGEAEYTLRIHSGSFVGTKSFMDQILALTDTTYVLVALGDDEENLKAALQLRMLFERMNIQPVIQTVIYDSEKKAVLSGKANYKDQPYRIDYIGDLDSSYTEKVIIHSELDTDALSRHLRGGYYTEEQFWAYEYFYHSSIAASIHAKMRILCNIPGADKPDHELTEHERSVLEALEHRRWNAYMRAEGYVFSGSTDKRTRNDLAKLHPDLVPFDMLSSSEKRKDSKIGAMAVKSGEKDEVE